MKKVEKVFETCKNCKHFYVTYNTNYPWGCKAFGFISKKYPYLEVSITSGMKCALFLYNNKNRFKINKKKKGRLA